MLSAKVSSYIDGPDDKIGLDVGSSTLPDGTSYVSQTTLDVPTKNITVETTNTGYRKAG